MSQTQLRWTGLDSQVGARLTHFRGMLGSGKDYFSGIQNRSVCRWGREGELEARVVVYFRWLSSLGK